MATSSFSKTFVFDTNATKKYQQYQKEPGYKPSVNTSDKLKEGKEALARFSPPSKK